MAFTQALVTVLAFLVGTLPHKFDFSENSDLKKVSIALDVRWNGKVGLEGCRIHAPRLESGDRRYTSQPWSGFIPFPGLETVPLAQPLKTVLSSLGSPPFPHYPKPSLPANSGVSFSKT